jgi:hypothetical protein
MATYKTLNISLVSGNAQFKTALTKIMNHSAFLKLRFKKNTRKRDLENIFTSMKIKFLQNTNVRDASSLTGPDIQDHDINYKKLKIRNLLIPEINDPTRKIMLRTPYYFLRKNRIQIVNEEFFNATLDRILNNSYQFSDIDYDGTAFYNTVKTALIQFLTSLSVNRVDGVTDKFSMVHTFCRRSVNTTTQYLDYENYIYKYINTLGFKIHEGHYIDYSGFGSMTSILLLLEKTPQLGTFMKTLPSLHYYSYTKKISLKTLVGRIKKNSKYL